MGDYHPAFEDHTDCAKVSSPVSKAPGNSFAATARRTAVDAEQERIFCGGGARRRQTLAP